jgi:hypothetical protein
MNPKKINMLSHRLAVLSNLMIETLDEIEANSDMSLEFSIKSKELMPFCEQMVDDVFTLGQIKSTTYMTDISNKVDTVIRKNYKPISQ